MQPHAMQPSPSTTNREAGAEATDQRVMVALASAIHALLRTLTMSTTMVHIKVTRGAIPREPSIRRVLTSSTHILATFHSRAKVVAHMIIHEAVLHVQLKEKPVETVKS